MNGKLQVQDITGKWVNHVARANTAADNELRIKVVRANSTEIIADSPLPGATTVAVGDIVKIAADGSLTFKAPLYEGAGY
jgi:hypothetical protein